MIQTLHNSLSCFTLIFCLKLATQLRYFLNVNISGSSMIFAESKTTYIIAAYKTELIIQYIPFSLFILYIHIPAIYCCPFKGGMSVAVVPGFCYCFYVHGCTPLVFLLIILS